MYRLHPVYNFYSYMLSFKRCILYKPCVLRDYARYSKISLVDWDLNSIDSTTLFQGKNFNKDSKHSTVQLNRS